MRGRRASVARRSRAARSRDRVGAAAPAVRVNMVAGRSAQGCKARWRRQAQAVHVEPNPTPNLNPSAPSGSGCPY